jgi:hypothetical protein
MGIIAEELGKSLLPLRIYSDKITPRLEYTCRIIFEIILQVPYSLALSSSQIIDKEGLPTITYTENPARNRFNIIPSGLIFEEDIAPVNIKVIRRKGLPLLFPAAGYCNLGFDIFSATFFMVTRYEEYLPFTPDHFGRFPEVESLSGKFDFTHIPVVHYWAMLLEERLKLSFDGLHFPKRKAKAIFTYDIDVAFAYKGRSLATHLLSLGKDLLAGKLNNIHRKITSGFGLKSDPSDTYNSLEFNPMEKIYFFLLSGKKTKYDRNIPPRSPVLRQLILRLKEHNAALGIHPSYYSSIDPGLITNEKQILQEIINQSVINSRQHFLKFKFPHTFRELLKAGVEHDYSIQYPEMPGFRAGICIPYPFFDVELNTITDLWLHPGCVMDTTFRDDLYVPAAQSLEWFVSLWEQVKKVGGEYICIWHNDTLWDHLPDNNPLAFKQIHDTLITIIQQDLHIENP